MTYTPEQIILNNECNRITWLKDRMCVLIDSEGEQYIGHLSNWQEEYEYSINGFSFKINEISSVKSLSETQEYVDGYYV